jgi:hypothetical protein
MKTSIIAPCVADVTIVTIGSDRSSFHCGSVQSLTSQRTKADPNEFSKFQTSEGVAGWPAKRRMGFDLDAVLDRYFCIFAVSYNYIISSRSPLRATTQSQGTAEQMRFAHAI